MHLLDLRDALLAGARALREDELSAPAARAGLARVLERTAEQLERIVAQSQPTAGTGAL